MYVLIGASCIYGLNQLMLLRLKCSANYASIKKVLIGSSIIGILLNIILIPQLGVVGAIASLLIQSLVQLALLVCPSF